MVQTKITPNPPPPSAHYKALYSWASDELLNECTKLTTVEDIENHLGDLRLYNFNSFCKTHDSHISIRHGTPGELVFVDERSNGGKPFFFLYQVVFKRIGLRLPFTSFERELLTEVNVAPAQLHPNGWAFVRAFQILCGYLGIPPSVDVFLHFFEVKKHGKSLWVSFFGVAGWILFTLFKNSFKGWKGNFFRVCCAKYDPTALDGFPLYWTEKPNPTKPKSQDELASADREVCVALVGLKVIFHTPTLISGEFKANAFSAYFGRESRPLLVFFVSDSWSCFSPIIVINVCLL